jgi:hypothetical protein
MTGNVCYGWWEILASSDFKCVIQVMKNVCYTWREKCSISNEKYVLHPTRKKCYKWWGMFATGDLKCVLHVIVMCATSDETSVPQVMGGVCHKWNERFLSCRGLVFSIFINEINVSPYILVHVTFVLCYPSQLIRKAVHVNKSTG